MSDDLILMITCSSLVIIFLFLTKRFRLFTIVNAFAFILYSGYFYHYLFFVRNQGGGGLVAVFFLLVLSVTQILVLAVFAFIKGIPAIIV